MSTAGSAGSFASRLGPLVKAASIELVLSRGTAIRAGLDPARLQAEAAASRDSANALDVLYAERTADLVYVTAPTLPA